jgi:hypothetical protein
MLGVRNFIGFVEHFKSQNLLPKMRQGGAQRSAGELNHSS